MLFASTKNKNMVATYAQAIFKGLSDDGALFHPIDDINLADLYNGFTVQSSFLDMASSITASLLKDEVSENQAKQICQRAFTFEPVLKKLDEGLSILELFHGPSAAFKDFGASFLASSMECFLENQNGRALILTATSGDTGSAVAKAFVGKKNIDVVILYPSKRVSPLQEKQLTTLGQNIKAMEVLGSFDDCQRIVKEAFQDQQLKKEYNLTSANSINVGRLIPQSFYYVWAWSRLKEFTNPKDIIFCVPSGNFGNLTAALLAKKWGLEIGGTIAATNRNCVVPDYLASGVYSPRTSVQTPSNAMDVGAPSNFERMVALYPEVEKIREDIVGYYFDDEATINAINECYKKYSYMVCPHTAVGILAAKKYLNMEENKGKQVVSLSTAHPGKFLEIVKEATGIFPPLPDCLEQLKNLEKQSTVIEPTLDDLVANLKKVI